MPVLPVLFRLAVQGGRRDRLGVDWLGNSAPVGSLVGKQAFYLGLDA